MLGVEADDLEQLLHPGEHLLLRDDVVVRSGVPTIVPTVCRGFSERVGSWKISWTSLRTAVIALSDKVARSWPSNFIEPAVGS